MNLSRKWLNEFVTVDASDKDFAEAMTLSGSKVEVTEDLGAEISNIVVGRILSMERHPDSDHMWVCQLEVGKDEPIQIVTGAWNVHVGDLVPAALHKSTLPGGKKIEKGKLRGVVSNGMMCGLSELGLDERDFPYAAVVAAALLAIPVGLAWGPGAAALKILPDLIIRALAALAVTRTQSLLLYPLAFGLLVCSRAHGISRTAMVPELLGPEGSGTQGGAPVNRAAAAQERQAEEAG